MGGHGGAVIFIINGNVSHFRFHRKHRKNKKNEMFFFSYWKVLVLLKLMSGTTFRSNRTIQPELPKYVQN